MAKLIHICGAARTGTTILGLALGQSRQVFYAGEIHALFRPFRTTHFDPACNCGMHPCPLWQQLGQLSAANYVNRISRQLGVDVIVDSSGDLPWFVDQHRWALEQDYALIDILTWKDPRELAHSQWKRGRPIENALRVFKNHYGRIIDLGVPFLAVELGMLTASPARMLQKICRLCEVDFNEDMVELPNAGHFLFGSAGVRARLQDADFRLGDDSVQIDYEPEFIEAYENTRTQFGDLAAIDAILERLRAHDVVAAPNVVASHASEIAAVKPAWYYKQRIYRGFRRYFPERFRN